MNISGYDETDQPKNRRKKVFVCVCVTHECALFISKGVIYAMKGYDVTHKSRTVEQPFKLT